MTKTVETAAPKLRFTLYSRSYCHLCEDMARALRERGVAFVEVDVDADAQLEARYGERVPVLSDPDGCEICHYFLDYAALARALG